MSKSHKYGHSISVEKRLKAMTQDEMIRTVRDLRLELWNVLEEADGLKNQIRAQEADILELYRAIRTQARGERLGMKLVPWEPTDKQLDAVAKAFPGKGLSQYARTIYKAMVSAAPGPDKESPKLKGIDVTAVIIDDPLAPHRDKPGASTTAVDDQDREGSE